MKRTILNILLTTILLLFCSGCAQKSMPNAENPVTLNMWHVYGSQTVSPLNNVIDEFNNTVGKENGITINVVSVTSSSAIDKALYASANGEPGAEDMPDLFTAYPRVAEIVGYDNLLCWNQYFTEEELVKFNEEFLSEGYYDEKLLMLPIAKSSEAFFLNKTLFDRFSEETGVSIDSLKTFNSLFETVNRYYDWSDGQCFMQINDYYNYAYIGMKAYGSEFIEDGKLQLNNEGFKKIWMPLAKTAIYGGIFLDDGYAASRWKTVEIISNIGSTADVLYQPNQVIYADNSTEEITTLTMPYPTFVENTAGAVYRGGGLFAVKSEDERKNNAAYLFAKWITQEQHNLDFVTNAGYLPVTDEAFDSLFNDINIVENKDYHSLYQAANTMIQDYTFYALPLYDGASNTQLSFENNVKAVLKSAHNQYLRRIDAGETPSVVLNELTESSYNELLSLVTE